MAPSMTSTGIWPKLSLLIWKNYLLQIRHPFQTIIDILLPVLMFVLLAFIHTLFDFPTKKQATEFPSLDVSIPWTNHHSNRLVFHPNNAIFGNLMNSVSEHLMIGSPYGVNESTQLESVVLNQKLIAAVEFHHPTNLTDIPKNLSYSLRFPSLIREMDYVSFYNWHTDNILPNENFNKPREADDVEGGDPSYHRQGFLDIQNAVARAFLLANADSKTEMPNVRIKRFPYPSYTFNHSWSFMLIILPWCVVLSFNYSFSNSVRFIALEKEKQLKEAMKIMGLQSWLHWLSWFLRSMTMLSISLIFIVILVMIPMFGTITAVFPNSNAFLITLFFLLYCFNLTTLSFFVSTFFSKAKAAITASTIFWYLSFIPYLIAQIMDDEITGQLKVFMCIFPNSAMAYGIKLIIRNEALGDGFILSTMWRPLNVYDNLTIGTTMGFLLLTACLFLMLTMYVESISPGSYGVAKPWYFPFKKDFWFSSLLRREFWTALIILPDG